MSPTKCQLLFGIYFLIAQHEERPLYHVQMVTSGKNEGIFHSGDLLKILEK